MHAAKAYFELKRHWPWQAVDGVFGQVEGQGGLSTRRRLEVSTQIGTTAAPEDAVLHCLGTHVRDLGELEQARAVVQEAIVAFSQAVAP